MPDIGPTLTEIILLIMRQGKLLELTTRELLSNTDLREKQTRRMWTGINEDHLYLMPSSSSLDPVIALNEWMF